MLKVTLLGTGGTQPLPERALAAAAVSVAGITFCSTAARARRSACGGTASVRIGFRRCCSPTTMATTFWGCLGFCKRWAV